MNALALVDLMLEMNVINAKDIDNEVNQMAARIHDPRAQKWFKRTARFFLINIDLLKAPLTVKAEPRPHHASKYYANPNSRVDLMNRALDWEPGAVPAEQGKGRSKLYSPLAVREAYDPVKQTYTTALHEPIVQRDIDQSFQRFVPAKAKAKRLPGQPPTKSELEPWMTKTKQWAELPAEQQAGWQEKARKEQPEDALSPEDFYTKQNEFHHFDPIQFRRRALHDRMQNLVFYLNYQTQLLAKKTSEDPVDRANAAEAEKLFQRMISMKADDSAGFREVLHDAAAFTDDFNAKPWKFTKDGKEIAKYNDLVLRRVVYPETAVAFSSRGQDEETNTRDPEHPGMYYPQWCTKTLGHATNYTTQGPLYFIDKNNEPYVLVHFPSNQVKNVQNSTVDDDMAKEIAPLFSDRTRFPVEDLMRTPALAREVDIPDRSRTVMELPEGYKLVKFTAPFDLAREGVLMGHCCGNASYQEKLRAKTHDFYSLRDPNNRSVTTLEVGKPNQVLQMKGRGNSTNFAPNIKAMLQQIVDQNRWQVTGDYNALR